MSTNELIDSIRNGSTVKANKAFDSVMKQKLTDALSHTLVGTVSHPWSRL